MLYTLLVKGIIRSHTTVTGWKGSSSKNSILLPSTDEVGDEYLEQVMRAQMITFFVNLISTSRFRHPNLVPLLGYSEDPDAIVYEFMSGGSLYHRLHEVSMKHCVQNLNVYYKSSLAEF